jgi:hypothetical protein
MPQKVAVIAGRFPFVWRSTTPPYSQQTTQRFGGRRSGMESMKANSASTCSCSQGSRFALSCNSDSSAASRSICSGVDDGGNACRSSSASRVDRLTGGLRHVPKLRSGRRDRSSLWAPLELNYSGHCVALLGRYGARRDRGDNCISSGDSIGRRRDWSHFDETCTHAEPPAVGVALPLTSLAVNRSRPAELGNEL